MGLTVVVLIVLISTPVYAGSMCGSDKLNVIADVVQAALDCQADAAASGTVVDVECVAGADAMLNAGLAEAETGGGCALTGDTAAIGAEIAAFVAGDVTALRPAPAASACSATKLRAVGDVTRRRLRCQRRGERKGTDLAAKCVTLGHDILAGGFTSAEEGGSCATADDATALNAAIDSWVERIAALTRPVRRVSVTSKGRAAKRPSTRDRISSVKAALSGDGRTIVFFSNAEDLVPGDQNGLDIFDALVHDVVAGTTEIASVSNAGAQTDNDPITFPAISADGRYVAFDSVARTLVIDDTNGKADVFVRDRLLGTTERVSVDSAAAQANGLSSNPSISADGRFVVFSSFASNLVSDDVNSWSDVFVRDRLLGTTERLSEATDGTPGDLNSFNPAVSADGAHVVFFSDAANLVPGDAIFTTDVFVVDRTSHTTELVSVTANGMPPDDPYGSGPFFAPAISADGRFIAFNHPATNIVAADTNGVSDIFVRDRLLGTTERVSVGLGDAEANGASVAPSISADGRFIAFESEASNLVVGDTNGVSDIFVVDRSTGITIRASVAYNGDQSNAFSFHPGLSADGRRLVFHSTASNLVRYDRNGRFVGYDAFLRSFAWD